MVFESFFNCVTVQLKNKNMQKKKMVYLLLGIDQSKYCWLLCCYGVFQDPVVVLQR